MTGLPPMSVPPPPKVRWHPTAQKEVRPEPVEAKLREVFYMLELLSRVGIEPADDSRPERLTCEDLEMQSVPVDDEMLYELSVRALVPGVPVRSDAPPIQTVYLAALPAEHEVWVLMAHQPGVMDNLPGMPGVVRGRAARRLRDVRGMKQDQRRIDP